MKEEIMSILKGVRPDIDFINEKHLLTDEVLDSFDVICIIGELSDKYSIEIDMDDVSEDNFNSIDGMIQMVERIKSRRKS